MVSDSLVDELLFRWVVLFSHELKKGESKPVEFMGHSLVVFRGEDGVAKVLDAYCPHLGANLGIGSRVVGDSLECAFHGWRFDGQGKCTLIPQQNMIPANAKLNCWPVREINGEIVVWHHADHETPRWEIPDFTKGFYLHGTSEHTIACHVQEIAENGPDCTHLNFLHKPFLGSSGINRVLHHMWNAEWTPGTDENQDRHFAYIKMEQGMGSFGKSWPGSTVYIDILQCGPGMVHINMPLIPGLFNIRIIEEVLPIGPMMQRVRHSVWGSATTPRFVAKLLLAVIIRFVEQDIPIWNNKTYLSKPIFSKHDGSISVYRRWYQQFYTASSPKASSLLNPLDW